MRDPVHHTHSVIKTASICTPQFPTYILQAWLFEGEVGFSELLPVLGIETRVITPYETRNVSINKPPFSQNENNRKSIWDRYPDSTEHGFIYRVHWDELESLELDSTTEDDRWLSGVNTSFDVIIFDGRMTEEEAILRAKTRLTAALKKD